MMKVLLTGGAGFIGSHTAVELISSGFDIVIADNFSNSSRNVIGRLEQIVGEMDAGMDARAAGVSGSAEDAGAVGASAMHIPLYDIDVCDKDALRELFTKEDIGAVIHFAGYKAVGESVEKPLMYYRNNIDSALAVLEIMQEFGAHIFVFSSSATVYGLSGEIEYREGMPTGGMNPYGWTKAMIEQILMDAAAADAERPSGGSAVDTDGASDQNADEAERKQFTPILLRYFNPVGAHESGLIGENPKGIPNNLMPFIQQVAVGKREKLSVFGDDYDTPDGTGVRDYIHVVDLARGHVKALEYAIRNPGLEIFNLGAGKGYSVLEVVKAFEEASGVPVPYVIAPRRPGDLPIYYANAEKARQILGWQTEKDLLDMCRDAWRWQQYCTEKGL